MAGAVSFFEMTPTDIANLALSRIGEKRISDIAENSPSAISCRANFEMVRDSLLRSHPWNFAIGRAELSETDTPVFGWSYAYALPSDFLRLSTLNGIQAAKCVSDYTLEGALILTNTNEAKITYVRRIADPTLFDSLFTEVLVYRLAGAVAMDVTGEPSKRDAMEQLAAMRLKGAAFVDSGENRATVAHPLDGLSMRLRGLPDWSINPPFPPFVE